MLAGFGHECKASTLRLVMLLGRVLLLRRTISTTAAAAITRAWVPRHGMIICAKVCESVFFARFGDVFGVWRLERRGFPCVVVRSRGFRWERTGVWFGRALVWGWEGGMGGEGGRLGGKVRGCEGPVQGTYRESGTADTQDNETARVHDRNKCDVLLGW